MTTGNLFLYLKGTPSLNPKELVPVAKYQQMWLIHIHGAPIPDN
jgi:hypothetical protein